MCHGWVIEVLRKEHVRKYFDCGEEPLNEYIKQFARSHAKKGISRTYVAVSPPSYHVVGFYSICAGSVEFHCLPSDKANALPRYPVPTAHLARLAVDRTAQKQGLGCMLLWDALERAMALADQIGICAVTVDALHNKARGFYLHYGFERLLDDPLHLFLMMETIRQAASERA